MPHPFTIVPVRPEAEMTRVEEQRDLKDRCDDAADAFGDRLPPELKGLFYQFQRAVEKKRRYWEKRAGHAEQLLHRLLAGDALTAEQRELVIATVYGGPVTMRDEKLLNEAEGRLVADYRAMDTGGRTMLRALCDRLASAHAQDPKADDAAGDSR